MKGGALLVPFVWASACSDYTVSEQKNGPAGGQRDSGSPCDRPLDSGLRPPCDSAALKDCVLAAASGAVVAVVDACLPEEPLPVSVFSLDLKWSYESEPYGPATRPSVVNLNDDDGDGIVGGSGDTPDVVFSSYFSNHLLALGGDGSELLWSVGDWGSIGEILTADVDADGSPDVCGYSLDERVQCLEADGTLKWESEPGGAWTDLSGITACDLEGDGLPEVISNSMALSGSDGHLLFSLDDHGISSAIVCADLDQDGTAEIVVGDSVYSHLGEVEWSFPVDGAAAFAAPLNADDDALAELFVVGSSLDRYEADGTLLGSVALPDVRFSPGPPCVADFDGDGLPDVGVASGEALVVFDREGVERWRADIHDGSGAAGCSGFDLDRDGAYELLFADERAFFVFDGTTGEVRYQDGSHNSYTGYEYPVIVDLDADGSAEIVVAESGVAGDTPGIRVYGRMAGDLPDAGPAWPVHDYGVTNVEADGGIPAHPRAGWLSYGLFHARPIEGGRRQQDLGGAILDACVEDCSSGPVLLSVQVLNQGSILIPGGTPWAVYAEGSGGRSLVTAGRLPQIQAGEMLPSFEIALPVSPSALEGGFVVVLGDDGTGLWSERDCDPTNNELRWSGTLCPGG